MDQSQERTESDSVDVFHRIRLEEREKKYHAKDDDDTPTNVWDGRDEQINERPMYDSRAGS